MMTLLAGVCGVFVAGDLFNLYVWIEVLLMASFVLLALGGERAQLEGALKYVALNLIASATLLVCIGLIYGMTGTLNLADLSLRLPASSRLRRWTPGGHAPRGLRDQGGHRAALVLAAGLVPHPAGRRGGYLLWPAHEGGHVRARPSLHAAVREDMPDIQPLLLVLAAVTMVVGVLGAVAQHEMRRLLSFHIISQIGYLVMGLGLFTVSAMAGLIYFLVHVAMAKATLFLISGLMARLTGWYELARTGGLCVSRPGMAVVFLIAAMSLAGMPPFSGFLAKLALIEAGLATSSARVRGPGGEHPDPVLDAQDLERGLLEAAAREAEPGRPGAPPPGRPVQRRPSAWRPWPPDRVPRGLLHRPRASRGTGLRACGAGRGAAHDAGHYMRAVMGVMP